ncbi:hypothetical protein DdX_09330 [Ditylenchus destructor]|uniref:Uncharacterized protein n=1 Tax=Ditylenchus destructor TaxID=166010 RepID=A0AAD4R636_9BILA|nr:hypothetical protein DdX_09330 [Ditylenchus destructor]
MFSHIQLFFSTTEQEDRARGGNKWWEDGPKASAAYYTQRPGYSFICRYLLAPFPFSPTYHANLDRRCLKTTLQQQQPKLFHDPLTINAIPGIYYRQAVPFPCFTCVALAPEEICNKSLIRVVKKSRAVAFRHHSIFDTMPSGKKCLVGHDQRQQPLLRLNPLPLQTNSSFNPLLAL